MEYNKIIAVTGLPGLYELLSSKSDGAIVRSLDDKSTRFVASRVHNFSHLESIEVYTVRDNVNLVDILKAMEASAEKLPDEKDNAALKAYFSKVYPDLDFDRVYSSDLKKMVKWFIVLQSNNIEIKLSEPEEVAEEVEVADEPEKKTAKPAPSSLKTTAGEKAAAEKAPAADKEKEKEPAKADQKTTAKTPAASTKTTAKKEAEPAEEEKPKAKKAAAEKAPAEKATAKPAAKKKAAAEKEVEEKPKKTTTKKKS